MASTTGAGRTLLARSVRPLQKTSTIRGYVGTLALGAEAMPVSSALFMVLLIPTPPELT